MFANKLHRGFTLIELLIVVAIIGLLAAMAVPNFLTAQVRAKVARTQADMNTLSLALEIYRVDNDEYPITSGPFTPSLVKRMAVLTTPIDYLSQTPMDPFQPLQQPYWSPLVNAQEPEENWDGFYVYNNGAAVNGFITFMGDSRKRSGWSLSSAGPDHTFVFPYYYFGEIFANNHWRFVYDPTNGSVSNGEIFLRGGNFLGLHE